MSPSTTGFSTVGSLVRHSSTCESHVAACQESGPLLHRGADDSSATTRVHGSICVCVVGVANAAAVSPQMGNLGFDPLGLLPTDPKERYDMQSKELNNGRLAMIAIAAFVAQELVSKDEIFEHVRQPALEHC